MAEKKEGGRKFLIYYTTDTWDSVIYFGCRTSVGQLNRISEKLSPGRDGQLIWHMIGRVGGMIFFALYWERVLSKCVMIGCEAWRGFETMEI